MLKLVINETHTTDALESPVYVNEAGYFIAGINGKDDFVPAGTYWLMTKEELQNGVVPIVKGNHMTKTSFVIETGAQSPLEFQVTETDIRGQPWPNMELRISVFQDESDTFYGSNLTFGRAKDLHTWLGEVLSHAS